MLGTPKIIEHPEVVGESKHSRAYQGVLPESYELKLRDFFSTLRGDIAASDYGADREAWLIGEADTEGDYAFSRYKIKRHTYDSWIWEFGRLLYEQTGHPLDADQYLVAFIPHYFNGGSCAAHQDNEPHMRDDWIVSVSLGSTIQFQYGATKTSMVSTELKSLSVIGMSRYLWHAVPKVKGDRWNITFRCWKSNPDFRRLTHTFAPAEARAASSMVSSRHKRCIVCDSSLASIDGYVVHLSERHKIPTAKAALVPFDLGECPFCLKYFTAARGWAKHTSSCKERGPLDSTALFPKTCWVWWGADKTWYKGTAMSITPESTPTYTVVYPDSSKEFTELSQFVVFADPSSIVPDESKYAPVPVTESEHSIVESRSALVSIVEIDEIKAAVVEDELEEGEIPCADVLPSPAATLEDLLPEWFTSKSCIPSEAAANKADLQTVLVDIHRASSQLRRLPPLRLWRGNQRRMWVRCTRQFTKYFQAALRQNAKSEAFLKLCLRLLELPSIILTQTLPDAKAPSEAKAQLSFKLKKSRVTGVSR